jgi:hypothetical protein
MNSTTKAQFTTLFGSSPSTVYILVMVLLVGILGFALLKIIHTAWNDVRTGAQRDVDHTDFFTTLIRGLVLLLIFGILFSH